MIAEIGDFLSRLYSFPVLNDAIAAEIRANSVVLDGEIVRLDASGKSQFRDLLFRRGEPRFYAFDALWIDGEHLRQLPIMERNSRLRTIVPRHGERLLYCDHVEADGEGLFQLACEHDLEGIVAKRKYAPYHPQKAERLKIRNRSYSQWIGREELFERQWRSRLRGLEWMRFGLR